jgi:NAD(P)H-flavin reductase
MLLTLPIREVVRATPRARVVRIDLQGESFPYLPGQAVMVATHGHEKRRPYSLAAPPEEAARENCLELLIGTDAEGSAGPHLSLEPGTLVDVDGPLGRFTFPNNPDADRFLFIAGGTGIAPLRAMLHRALSGPSKSIGVVYSARTAADFAYDQELRGLAAAQRIELRQAITRDDSSDPWHGIRGRIGSQEIAPLLHDPKTVCFICGPPTLVHEIPKLLQAMGVAPERIRIEEWG